MRPKLTEGRVSLQLLILTLPMAWGFLSLLAFGLADTYFVAKLGTQELAAMSFTFPVVNVFYSVAMGLGIGASSVIARGIGEGDHQKVKRLTTDSLLLSVVVVTIFVLVGLASIKPVFRSLGAGPAMLPLIQDYMSIWYLGMAFIVIPMVGNSAIRASGNTFVPSVIMTLAAGINILIDPILIFGWGPVPALEIRGAAIATAISYGITLIASLLFLHFREDLLSFEWPKPSKILANWKHLLQIGIPATVTNLIAPLSVGIITSLLAQHSAEVVAAFGLASRLESVALIFPTSLAGSLGPFVGQNWGAQKGERIRQALMVAFLFSLGWGAFMTVLLGTMGTEIAAGFNQNPEVISNVSIYLTVLPISYGSLGIILAASSAFNAMGKPIAALKISLLRLLIIYIPLAYLGNWLFGVIGIFGAACLTNITISLWVYFLQPPRNQMSLPTNLAPVSVIAE